MIQTAVENVHTVPDINSVVKKMLDAGLVRSAIDRFFIPAWCDSSALEDAGARQAAFLEIAKRLGVTYTELVSDDISLQLDLRWQGSAFRKSKNKETAKLVTSRFVGIRLSDVIAEAYFQSREFVNFSRKNVRVCRESILVGEPWISFNALLNFCWQCGIPVVYHKGEKGQAFDGLSIMTPKGIPVIILASGKNTAWTSFHLAHELGHIMLGHLDMGQKEMSKEQEDDADNFAHSLLCGFADLPTVQPNIPTAELKRIAVNFRVSPTALLLNCHNKTDRPSKDYAILNKRLSHIHSVCDTRRCVCELLRAKIGDDFEDVLSPWQIDFLDSLLA